MLTYFQECLFKEQCAVCAQKCHTNVLFRMIAKNPNFSFRNYKSFRHFCGNSSAQTTTTTLTVVFQANLFRRIEFLAVIGIFC